LFKKLIERFNPPDISKMHKDKKEIEAHQKRNKLIQLRVSTFLKDWLSLHDELNDIDKELLKRFSNFAKERISKNGNEGIQIANKITQTANARLSSSVSHALKVQQLLPAQPKIFNDISPVRFVLDTDPNIIASVLTEIEFKLYSQLKASEFLLQSWIKYKFRAPNVSRMINRFNDVSLWVGSCILWQPDIENRIAVFSTFITIADKLLQLNNFNSLFAILAGLQLSAIYRLQLHEKINKKKKSKYEQLLEFMSSKGSFSNYRKALGAVPCIPYLGLYLTDLVFVDEGNPNKINNVINWRKREQIYTIINSIQQFQHFRYEFPPTTQNILAYLQEVPHHEKDLLYNFSLMVEPRKGN